MQRRQKRPPLREAQEKGICLSPKSPGQTETGNCKIGAPFCREGDSFRIRIGVENMREGLLAAVEKHLTAEAVEDYAEREMSVSVRNSAVPLMGNISDRSREGAVE